MNGVLIGRVRGIDLLVNWSVLVVGWLIAWSLAVQVFPEVTEGHSEGAYWLAAVLTTLAFLAGLVAHELGHSLVALRHGVEVRAITLWLFGGVAQLGSTPPDPRAALRIAAAGPIVSVGLGLVAIGAASTGGGGLAATAVLWFGSMNLFLAAFNLLPAYPLDGGRIYQAWQWRRTGDERAATQRAARVGVITGGVLVWLGVIELLFAGVIGGLWLMAIGWFLREAARTESMHAVLEGPLRSMTVASVMSANPETVRDTASIAQFVSGAFVGGRHAAYPVVDVGGAVVALMAVNDVRRIPPDEWDETPVAVVATPLERIVTVQPTDSVAVLSERLGVRAQNRALVLDDLGGLVGIVSPSDLARLLALLDLQTSSPMRSNELTTPTM